MWGLSRLGLSVSPGTEVWRHLPGPLGSENPLAAPPVCASPQLSQVGSAGKWDLFMQGRGRPVRARPGQGRLLALHKPSLGRGAPGGGPAITADSGSV